MLIVAAGIQAVLLAAVLTPSQILTNPSTYEGRDVTVSGTVTNLQVKKSMFRKVTGFQLCDTKCIVVIDEKNAEHHDGETATVSGTFRENFKGPKRSFTNVVVIQ
jgi:hypothetical protein